MDKSQIKGSLICSSTIMVSKAESHKAASGDFLQLIVLHTDSGDCNFSKRMVANLQIGLKRVISIRKIAIAMPDEDWVALSNGDNNNNNKIIH